VTADGAARTGARFAPGRVIERREVLHGMRWLTHPVTVVDDTDDHGLDIVVPADGTPWQWKDLGDPAAMAAAGRITAAEAQQIHADARSVAELLDADDRWWAGWDDWTPSDRDGEL